jgi:LysM repeat protein
MELEKSNIHMNKIVESQRATFYVTKECNLPEQSMESIINHQEKITLDSGIIRGNQVIINGNISYGIMFYGEDNAPSGVTGEIPFEENIKINTTEENIKASVDLIILSGSIKMIDNRNYIYKIQVMANINIEKIEDIEAVCAISRENTMTKYKTIENLMILADRNETFRINERISLPSGSPAIEKIIWRDVKIRKLTTKMLEGMIHLSGQLKVFIMYTPEEQSIPVQWFDTVIDFSGTLEAPEAREDLISYICGDIHNVELEDTMNQDNEMKDLDISALLKLSIKIYEENKMDVLEDIYAPDVDLCPMEKEQKYEKLLVKNESRTKNIIKIDVDQSKGHILQICNSDTRLQIDNISVGENNLKVTGKIRATIIYISSDDIYSICCQTKETDFEHRIDTEGISKDDKYYINWKVEQVSSNMISTNQVEVKSVIALQAMVFKEEKCNFVWDIEEKPVDWAKFNDAPILKGYIVRKGDTLWKLAKANYTTVDNIMKINQLENEKIREGDKLLLVKNCQ